MAYPASLQIDYAAPYETTATQLYPIGQKAEDTSGSVFRYTLMGSTVGVANKLYQSAIPTDNWRTETHTVEATAGDTSISFNDGGTAFTVNQAAGGTVLFEETGDEGGFYQIKSNVVTASNETIMQLEDGVTIQFTMAVAANNVMTFILNPWSATIITPTAATTAGYAGVSRVVIAANAFGWTQTRGPCSCLIETDTSALLVGNGVHSSLDVAGAVSLHDEIATEIDVAHLGFCMNTAPTGDFGHIFLQIE